MQDSWLSGLLCRLGFRDLGPCRLQARVGRQLTIAVIV